MFAGIGHPTSPAAVPTAPAAPVAPSAPAAPAAPGAAVHQMTAAATTTYEEYIKAGWTDDTLIQNALMLPPGGVPTSF